MSTVAFLMSTSALAQTQAESGGALPPSRGTVPGVYVLVAGCRRYAGGRRLWVKRATGEGHCDVARSSCRSTTSLTGRATSSLVASASYPWLRLA